MALNCRRHLYRIAILITLALRWHCTVSLLTAAFVSRVGNIRNVA
ncbi:hypothetical protein APY04_0514 [Hyphomicrobium sulfonivorans]|uniref:Uncharacterized protein n=1 Tax=Hyphomicrobium sulfonivorans TaxID=121290 RepID=A0A120CXN8_HYPSL|nr:hypothetical protein APY04_0514 [Hyphomicrobium sulfonivorans]